MTWGGFLLIGLASGLILREFLPSYFREKAKNLATKEDIGAITKAVEDIKTENQLVLERAKPLTAEETLRREALLKGKLDAYYNALEVIYRKFASNDMLTADQPDSYLKPADLRRPAEYELNAAYGRLALFAGDRAILDKYLQIHSTKSSPADLGDLLALMRRDLGQGAAIVPGTEFGYVFGTERERARLARPET